MIRVSTPLRWAALLLALLSPRVFASGLDCELALNDTEEAICADPVLKQMDDELATAWTRARADRDVAEALIVDQPRWLRERDACGADVACLRPVYARRIAELDETRSTFRWPGTWTRIGGHGEGGRLVVLENAIGAPDRSGSGARVLKSSATKPNTANAMRRYRISLDASAGANTGSISGEASGPGPDSLTLASPTIAPRCRIVLHRVGRFVDVEQNDDACGAGNGVTFAGRYVPGDARREPVQWTLLSLGVIVQPDDDARVRALVGTRDYAALVTAADTIEAGRDLDQLDARVTQLSVRGLATLHEALLMQAQDGRIWIALLDFDAQRRPQVRYYSNDPAWSTHLPATVEAWRRRFSGVPVRMMPISAQPGPMMPPTHD